MEKRAHREVSRIEGFADAVFAFAVTLLVVSLEVPKTFEELLVMMRGFPAFAVSFALLFQIWWRHYRFFRTYGMDDSYVIGLTGVLLFIVLVYVYPLKFLWSLLFAQLGGDVSAGTAIKLREVPLLFEIYGAGVAATFGVLAALYAHAYRRRGDLGLTPLEAMNARIDVYRNLSLTSIGVLSIVVAAILGSAAPGWIAVAGWVYALIGISEWRLGAYQGRLARRLEGSEPAITA